MVTIIGLLWAITSAGQAGAGGDRPATEFLTGPKFQLELEQATSGSWANVELRSLFQKLSTERRVAILLDRRVDPTTRLPVDIVNRSLRDGLQDLARKVNAEISVPENVVYVGPPAATRKLRTLIELRSAETQTKLVRENRRNELSKRQSYSWDDLNTPGDVLATIADRCHLTVRHPDLIPHDLWAEGHLPSVTCAEALSLVLVQFDLTFSWIDGGQGIELGPIPATVSVERRPRAKGRSSSDIVKLIAERFPQVETQGSGGDLIVRGTVEEQEAITDLLSPTPTKKPAGPAISPLSQRTFTLTFKRAPVRAVMKKLEESSIVFVYDAAALNAANIDLNQTVDLQLEKASADEFFKALFGPLNLSFEIDHVTVRLSPKK